MTWKTLFSRNLLTSIRKITQFFKNTVIQQNHHSNFTVRTTFFSTTTLSIQNMEKNRNKKKNNMFNLLE